MSFWIVLFGNLAFIALINGVLALTVWRLYVWGKNPQAPSIPRAVNEMFTITGTYLSSPAAYAGIYRAEPDLVFSAPQTPTDEPEPLVIDAATVYFLLREIEMHLHFTPKIDGVVAYVTPKQHRKLREYCDFAFEQPRTPEYVFGLHGMVLEIR